MERLLADAQKITGIKYDISNLSDVYNAIHVIQTELGITGTTAKEAMFTIQGSMNATKAAWQNVLTAIAGGGDLNKAIQGLSTALFGKGGSGGLINNLKPRFIEAIKGFAKLLGEAAPIIATELPALLSDLTVELIGMLPELLTQLAKAAVNLLSGLGNGVLNVLGALFGKAKKAVDKTSDSYKAMKSTIEAGIKGTIALESDDGKAVLDKVDSIVDDIQKNHPGTLVIDGDPQKAEAALASLDEAVSDMISGEGSVKVLQDAINDCKNLQINPDLSDDEKKKVIEKLNGLKGELDKLQDAPITLTANGHQALLGAQAIIKKLQTDAAYKGSITINGNADGANTALANLETAISDMIKDGGSLKNLQGLIEDCESLEIDPTIDENQRHNVEIALNGLKDLVAQASGEAKITYSYKQTADSNPLGFSAFVTKIKELGYDSKQFDYSATGKFEIEPQTTDNLNAYAAALAAAALATKDYDAAVENLNALLEKQLNAKTASIQNQAAEQMQSYSLLYNAGIISHDDYVQMAKDLHDSTQTQIKDLQKEYEAQKAVNDLFSDGSLQNDAETWADQTAKLFEGQEISIEQYQDALATVAEKSDEINQAFAKAAESGEALQLDRDTYVSALLAYDYLMKASAETSDKMTDAAERYNTELKYATKLAKEAATAEKDLENARGLANEFGKSSDWDDLTLMLTRNDNSIEGKSREDVSAAIRAALAQYDNVFDENTQDWNESFTNSVVDMLSKLYTNENGEGIIPDSSELASAVQEIVAGYEEKAEKLRQTATDAQQTAESNFKQATQDAAQNNQLTADGVEELLTLLTKAGVKIEDKDKKMLTQIEKTAEETAKSVVDGGENSYNQALNAIERITSTYGSSGRDSGSAYSRSFSTQIDSMISAVKRKMVSFRQFLAANTTVNFGPNFAPTAIDWHDDGGIFTRPTIIGVGEKRPEIVGALDDFRKIVREESGGRGQQTNNFYITSNDPDEVARKVSDILQGQYESRKSVFA